MTSRDAVGILFATILGGEEAKEMYEKNKCLIYDTIMKDLEELEKLKKSLTVIKEWLEDDK